MISLKSKKVNYHRASGYRIPQFDVETHEGLKTGKSRFRPSQAGSPLFGSNVKDVMTYTDVSKEVDIDVRQNYDFARTAEDKVITREEMIRKYGTEYPEFRTVTEMERKKVYGDDITITASQNGTLENYIFWILPTSTATTPIASWAS